MRGDRVGLRRVRTHVEPEGRARHLHERTGLVAVDRRPPGVPVLAELPCATSRH